MLGPIGGNRSNAMEDDALSHGLQTLTPRLPLAQPCRGAVQRLEGQAMLAAIAEQLLSRIVIADEADGIRSNAADVMGRPLARPYAPPQMPWDEEAPSLTDFDLSGQAGRLGFLCALFMHHYRQGLLMAVNHVWASLARPKAVRCQIMAQALKLPGTGKVALKNVLAAFLEETLYGVDFPPLPNVADFAESDAWNDACVQHFDGINAQFDAIYHRYEAILDGRVPSSQDCLVSVRPMSVPNVIQGPWANRTRGYTAMQSAVTRGVHRGRGCANASCEEQDQPVGACPADRDP